MKYNTQHQLFDSYGCIVKCGNNINLGTVTPHYRILKQFCGLVQTYFFLWFSMDLYFFALTPSHNKISQQNNKTVFKIICASSYTKLCHHTSKREMLQNVLNIKYQNQISILPLSLLCILAFFITNDFIWSIMMSKLNKV